MPNPLLAGPFADWELTVLRQDDVLAYNVASLPQYWIAFSALPRLSDLQFSGKADPPGRGWLIDASYDARIVNVDGANVATAGFVSGQIMYGTPYGGLFTSPQSAANEIPGLSPGNAVAGEAYDPTPLPISGIDHPVWTRTILDPLTIRTYLDESMNPGLLWGIVIVQVNGVGASVNAATVESRWRWNPVA